MKIGFILLASSVCFQAWAFAESDSCRLNIRAIDLTEDMSSLSTQNDEMLLMLYAQADTSAPIIPILLFNHTFEKQNRSFATSWLRLKEINRLFLLLVEMDSQRTKEQIDAVIRIYHAEIYRSKLAEDRVSIGKFFGDDDLIGFSIFDGRQLENCNLEFSISGFFLLDKYEYRITLSD